MVLIKYTISLHALNVHAYDYEKQSWVNPQTPALVVTTPTTTTDVVTYCANNSLLKGQATRRRQTSSPTVKPDRTIGPLETEPPDSLL